jgi:ATP-dependent DNA helicase RecG
VFNYPYEAIEEALVNAVYHRSYEIREPIEVRVNPDRIEILSFPGPDPSISLKSLNAKRFVTRRYRNRRIGEFLKELELTEGRGTGIPTMRQALRANGSPPPRFVTDRNRTSFLVEVLINPAFLADREQPEVSVEVPVEAPVELNETERAILVLCKDAPQSKSAILAGLGYGKMTGNVWKALQRLTELKLIELTIPGKPNSKLQRRRITDKGRAALSTKSSGPT